ncbi:maleylpyruvate isomerase N-terminal domain-containing protein [Nocardia concava]|uniref:maleylpyruvate isomerase N-terminal domain-containing protein n=1 Tax=Nocardia concava TaxID=257281 RepID=UPI0005939B4F|nr:maleylpyruvate isomerase N-terminal domain-containing protein [Nocardia concava]
MDIAVLEQVWQAWARRVPALTEDEWAAPTRLPGWSVRDLLAHVAPGPSVLDHLRGPHVAEPLVVDGPDMLRRFNLPGGAAHTMAADVAERARQEAVAGPATVIDYFLTNGPVMLALLSEAEPAAGIAHPVLGSVSFRALAEVGVVEATVHLLDLIAAIGGPPPPEAALRRSVEILAAVPPSTAFIEAVTGRGPAEAVVPILR